jgi:GNAT superfamily N-acetyltransferase
VSQDGLFEALLMCAGDSPRVAGVSQTRSPTAETYIYRTADLEIIGILRVLSNGVFAVAVKKDFQRRGIGTALLSAANQDKPIDFSKSSFSLDGEALVEKFVRINRMKVSKVDSTASTHGETAT